MIDSFNNINELSNDDGRIVRANFSLKLQGYIVPDNVQKKLKEQNTRYFSKAQIILNQSTTIIDEPGKKLQSVKSTGGGGGSITKTTINNTNVGQDDDWTTTSELLVNGNNRNVQINNAYLTVDIGNTKTEDIFIIKKNNEAQLTVNNNGILSLKNFDSFPDVVPEGGFLIKNNEFYVGV